MNQFYLYSTFYNEIKNSEAKYYILIFNYAIFVNATESCLVDDETDITICP